MGAESAETRCVVLGDFELGKKLGQGGMGSVYLAHQISLDRPCAVKLLSKEMAERPGFVERFIREARAMARINHPGVVACYAVGDDNGQHYVAMELVDGHSMQVWLSRLGILEVGDALRVAITVAETLHFAHEKKMIHRDVKPDNILLTRDGVIKLSDLGLAKAIDHLDMSLTQSGMGLGTPHYMPPEQARDAKHVDQSCDVYALGSTLYHFLTGRLPFHGDTLLDLIANKERGKFSPARQLNKAVPDRLSLMIDRAMAKDPRSRYPSCAEFAADLASLRLAHESLSFIGMDARSPLRPAAGRATAIGGDTLSPHQGSAASSPENPYQSTQSMPAAARGKSAPKSKTISHRKSSTMKLSGRSEEGGPSAAEGIWFVKYFDDSGKAKVEKLSTAGVLRRMRADRFDPRTKAAQNSRGPFLPLSQYPVFVSEVERMLVRYKARHRHADVAAQYDKLARQYERLKWWHLLRRIRENTLSFVGLLIWIAVIGGVGFALYWGIPIVYDKIAEQVGFREEATSEQPAAQGEDGARIPPAAPPR